LAEQAVRQITKDTKLNHIILRPTGVMGEGDTYTALELIAALNNGDMPVIPGDGEKHIMYTHVDDVIEGFVCAVKSTSALNQTFIICADEPMTYNELFVFLGEKLGVTPPKRRVPISIAKFGIGLLSPIKNRRNTTFLWHKQTVQSMDEDRWYTNKQAKRILGWSPKISMREGIGRQIEWAWESKLIEKRV